MEQPYRHPAKGKDRRRLRERHIPDFVCRNILNRAEDQRRPRKDVQHRKQNPKAKTFLFGQFLNVKIGNVRAHSFCALFVGNRLCRFGIALKVTLICTAGRADLAIGKPAFFAAF
ncbi:MAG: hypothetical protein ACI4O5_05765 [Oscillospiraceae bacterium]